MSISDKWIVQSRRLLMDRPPWLKVWAERIRTGEGKVVDDYLTLEAPSYVIVVAITSSRKVVLERSYKHGLRKNVPSLPAGYIEKNERPLEAARRELREETGYVGGKWENLGSYVVDGNRTAGKAYVYLASGVKKRYTPSRNDLEKISVEEKDISELAKIEAIRKFGQLSTVAALLLALNTLKHRKTDF